MKNYASRFLARYKGEIYTKLPEGWRISEGALTAPNGYAIINNGKPLFGGEHRTALLKLCK